MIIGLHPNARTTPARRSEIARSDEPVSVLARRYGGSETMSRRWKDRDEFIDRSHTPPSLADQDDPGSGGHRGGTAQNPAVATR